MTKIVEPLDKQSEIDFGTEPDEQDNQEQNQQAESNLPEKYQGKSIEEIVKMHQEAEKLLGRQSSEVGELRTVVDDFIKAKSKEINTSPNQQQSDPEVDFYTDPDKAVKNVVSNSDEIKELKEFAQQTKQQQILAQINAKYPDLPEIVKDPAFAEWVTSSNIRKELFQRAEQKFDFDAADELLSTWKERQEVVSKTQDMQEQDKKKQRKAASTGNVRGSGEPASRKIYKRADIVNLMIKDPERYKANIDEFDKAYREGRVK